MFRLVSSAAAPLCAGLLMSLGAQAQTVHEPTFQAAIDSWMDNRVKGYAFVIADKDGIVAEAAGGWAQAPGDGNLRMSATIPAGFGSNQKVLSGNALLDLLEDRSPLSVAQELKTPIRFFVPDRWIQAYFNAPGHETLNAIRLRDLLDHTSALPQESDGGAHGTRIARALSQGADAGDFASNKVEYNNNNYTLLLYIIPALAYPGEVDAIERAAEGLSLRDYNVRVANEYGKLYTRYMGENFLARTLAPVRGTCRPGDLPGNRYAKEYDTRNSGVGQTDNASGFCRSQGSWFYSARDMAQIWRTIEFSDRIVKPSTRRLYRASVNPRPIYWRSFSHAFLGAESSVDTYRGHGGGTRFGSTSVTIRLPWGHVGIGVANSDELSPIDLGNILLNAFYEATRKTFEYDTDRPGSDLTSIILGNPDPALCAKACDGNSRCKSWTYVMPRIQHPFGAKCWLKEGIPGPRRQAHVISGIKGADYGIDRPGNNLRSVEVGKDDPALCRLLCAAEAKCKAWTHVRAGLQGDRAVCWLKRSVAQARDASCCVSGLRP